MKARKLRVFCILLVLPLLCGTTILAAQTNEICDNAQDDDGDGLIDINDPDCICKLADPVSLIPNPSFEEMNCCPSFRSQLHCAETWIQASEPTTDYIHTCGWMGWDGLPVPLPLPDGDACVGYRNGRFGDEIRPNWKEYTGACLLSPLKAGVRYRFEFFLGFTHQLNSPGTNVVFYGTTDCQNLPFGVNDATLGCPTNGPDWKRLGSVFGRGVNEWIKRDITITPDEDIYAIAIGPDCQELNANQSIYYFFDNLVLASEAAFEFEIRPIHHPCAEDFTVQVVHHDSLQYQWYKDGIALIGETSAQLNIRMGEGRYQVRILSEEECKLARPYYHKLDEMHTVVEANICKGEEYYFEEHTLTETGIYWDTLKTIHNCDSVLQLHLSVEDDEVDTIQARILEGEHYAVGPYSYNQPGQYLSNLHSELGCDSLIYLDLDFYTVYIPNAFSPNNDGINDVFKIFGGSDLIAVNHLKIFNRWGGLSYDGENLTLKNTTEGWNGMTKGEPAPIGMYTYMAVITLDDGKERVLSGALVLTR